MTSFSVLPFAAGPVRVRERNVSKLCSLQDNKSTNHTDHDGRSIAINPNHTQKRNETNTLQFSMFQCCCLVSFVVFACVHLLALSFFVLLHAANVQHIITTACKKKEAKDELIRAKIKKTKENRNEHRQILSTNHTVRHQQNNVQTNIQTRKQKNRTGQTTADEYKTVRQTNQQVVEFSRNNIRQCTKSRKLRRDNRKNKRTESNERQSATSSQHKQKRSRQKNQAVTE